MYIGALRSKITAKRLPFLLLLFFTAWTRTNVCSWIPISSQHWLRGLLCVCGWEFAPRDPLSVRFASQCRDRVLGTNLGAHVQDCAGNAAERHIRRKWGWSYQRREGEKFDIILIVFNLNLWKITNKITKSWFFFFWAKTSNKQTKKNYDSFWQTLATWSYHSIVYQISVLKRFKMNGQILRWNQSWMKYWRSFRRNSTC